MQTNYGTAQPQWTIGQVADISWAEIDSYGNELLAQISTVTIGGTAANGDYEITAEGPDGETVTASFTRAAAEANAAIATALIAAIAGDDDWANVAVASSGGSAVVTLSFVHPGRGYTITTSAPSGATAVVATSQAAGGVDVPVGVVCQFGSSDDLAAIVDGSTTDADVAGIVVRGVDALVNDYGAQAAVYGPGKMMSVMRKGVVPVLVEDAVTKGAAAFARIASPAAGDPLGLFRSDDDGGDAIAIAGARFDSTTTGRGVALVRINRP